jgi:hypothetical protein
MTHREVLSVHLSEISGSTNTSAQKAVATSPVAGLGTGSVVVVGGGGGLLDVGGGVLDVGGGVLDVVGVVGLGEDPVVGGVVPDDVVEGLLVWPEPPVSCPFVPPARGEVRGEVRGAPVCEPDLPLRTGELRFEGNLGSDRPETS